MFSENCIEATRCGVHKGQVSDKGNTKCLTSQCLILVLGLGPFLVEDYY